MRLNKTVYSTEEFSELKQAAERAGARIVGTSLTRGAGICVEIELGAGQRQF